jgi:hypothetical protein
MKLIEKGRNVHVLDIPITKRNYSVQIAMLSDLHWDNPKSDWDLLKKHFDYFKKNNIRVHLNGDTFCLMQGKYDPRSSKKAIRKEHMTDTYFQTVAKTAAEWFKPYAHLIDVVGYGNHETSVLRRQEVDVLDMFITELNRISDTDHKVMKGGYGGWYIVKINTSAYKIKYFHGSGGGGIVTKGAINLTRAKEKYQGFDCFTLGHIHENTERWDTVETLDDNNNSKLKDILLMITGTYKEEYGDGYMHWHVERGAPAKPIGGRLLELTYCRRSKSKKNPKHGGAITARSVRL